ncbi:hypothetical protein SAMN00808754_3201 [Thermanaeromonas toyohensis ToBE]|uniref:HD domain-containing protein n=1 Tax=Thermanaeromonas toyohensis ToBE TaxID=698762 RepID=A0A1W1W2Y7_9FIRM|nr:hypothetical protein [Thermanaeromonas toyohensis]SMB99989.1 hypothetical protein SAMN00808754_3201 [Thermanaeromonas toyohensis ToBE]
MSIGRCPGQDRRYWKPEDIFEEPCPHCGKLIEFWKDDVTVRCPHCRQYVKNPRFDPGCAAWCSYASKCLGPLAQVYQRQPRVLRDKLEVETRKKLLNQKEVLTMALQAASFAEKIAREEGVEPLVAIAACLLYDVEEAERIMASVGIDEELAQRVMGVLVSRNKNPGDPAWAVVQDARKLAKLQLAAPEPEARNSILLNDFYTETAKRLSQNL